VDSNVGNALVAKGDPDGAIREYREAIRLKPDYAEAHSSLGNALSARVTWTERSANIARRFA